MMKEFMMGEHLNESELTDFLDTLNLVQKARLGEIVLRLKRELQGKALLAVPHFQLAWMFGTGLRFIDYPADQVDDAAEKLATKFADFLRT
jgi:hypothetical protein